MSLFDTNTLYRLISANRSNTLPTNTNPSLNTTPPNPKIYFSLGGGSISAQTFTMKTQPPLTAAQVVDMGNAWFFRYPEGATDDNCYTIHNARTGAKMALERQDTKSTGALKMAPLTKGKASQIWYFVSAATADRPATSGSGFYTIQESAPASTGRMGAPAPAKLDVVTRGEQVLAKVIVGNPIDPNTNRPYLEGTVWDVQSVRGMQNADEAGVGFS